MKPLGVSPKALADAQQPVEGVESAVVTGDGALVVGNWREQELIRLALEFVIANRGNPALHMNSEYRSLADACEAELMRRISDQQQEKERRRSEVRKKTGLTDWDNLLPDGTRHRQCPKDA